MRVRTIVAVAALACSCPALAVGLGPLSKEGVTYGPVKAFYLELINPYPTARSYSLYAIEADSDQPVGDTQIVPDRIILAGERTRKLVVLLRALSPGETRTVRVCAQLTHQEGAIHARVCSKLIARRAGAGA